MSIFKKIMIIVLLVVFIVSCIVGTYYVIQYNNKQSYELNSETLRVDEFEKKEDNSYLGMKYDDKYVKNNITFEPAKIEVKEGVMYSYYKISGLKNKTVQEKINNDIFNIATQAKLNNISINLEMKISFNVENILSIIISNYYGKYSDLYICYDLTTGNRIKFADLFINNCQQELWNDYICHQLMADFIEFNEDENLNVDDYIFSFKKYYNENFENLSFVLHENYMNVKINETLVSISYNPLVAFFNKYKTDESIFENGQLAAERYCFLRVNDLYQIEEYKDNIIFSMNIINTSNEEIKAYFSNYYDKYMKEYKIEFDQNLNISRCVEYQLNVDEIDSYPQYPNLCSVAVNKLEYKTSKEEYKNNLKKEIFYAKYNNTLYYIDEAEYNKDKIEINHILENYLIYKDPILNSWKELKVSELFVEGYNYLNVAKEKMKVYLEEQAQKTNAGLTELGKIIEELDELPFNIRIDGYLFVIDLNNNTITIDESYSNYIGFYFCIEDVFDINMIK